MGEIVIPGLPNPRQKEFFLARAKHIAYGGARGGGKSWAMRRKLIMLAMNYRNLHLLLLRRTLPELRENHIIPLLSELHGVAVYKESEKAFIFPNGSRIKLGYCEHENDVYQYQGQEYDVIGLEEATHFTEAQMIFITTCLRSTRDDFESRIYYTANPGNVGHAWFKRLFVDRDYRGDENPDDYVFIPAKVFDNTILMERDPNYVKILMNLPEDLKRAHLYGDWDVFAGQFYGEFRREIHVIEPFTIPSWWKRFISLDYGLDMTAAYWWAVNDSGKCHIYRELYEPNLILTEAAKRVIDATPDNEKGSISYVVASPDLWNRRQETGFSGQEIMAGAGLKKMIKADNNRITGWRAIHEYLTPYSDEQEVLTANMVMFNTCSNLVRSFPQLQHDKNNPEDVGDENHEVTHGPESIRYGVMSRPRLAKVPVKEPTGDAARIQRDIARKDKKAQRKAHRYG